MIAKIRERYLSPARWRLRAHFLRERLLRWRVLVYYGARHVIARRPGAPAVCIATVDEAPLHPWYVVWKVCHLLGLPIRPLAAARAGDIRWAWLDATTCDPVPGAINGDCTDIRKSRVDAAMRQVFGYGAEVEPATHTGLCVRKSEQNGVHDGQIVRCPTDREPGFVYQRLIDSRVGDEVEDLRVVIVGSTVPFIYRKRRDLADRFLAQDNSIVATDPGAAFTDEELTQMLEISELMGLDVGELDVLRDNQDGRIYVVDVNKTPVGPPARVPSTISWRDSVRAAWMLAEAWHEHLFGVPRRRRLPGLRHRHDRLPDGFRRAQRNRVAGRS